VCNTAFNESKPVKPFKIEKVEKAEAEAKPPKEEIQYN